MKHCLKKVWREKGIGYASWGPIFWLFFRSSAQDLTMKAVRGTAAVKGIFDN